MSKFTAGTYVRCMDAEDAATAPREDSLVEGRVYRVAPCNPDYSGVNLRGQAEQNWREDRFELATGFMPGDHARIDTADNIHKGMEGRVVEVESAERGVVEGGVDWRLVRFKGDKGGLHACRFSHVGHDTPLTPLNEKPLPSSSPEAAEKYVPKVGDLVRVKKPAVDESGVTNKGPGWYCYMNEYDGLVAEVSEVTALGYVRLVNNPYSYDSSWVSPAHSAATVKPEERLLMLPAKDSSSCSSLALEELRKELDYVREDRNELLDETKALRGRLVVVEDERDYAEGLNGRWSDKASEALSQRDAARNALSLSMAEVDALKKSLENYKKAQPKPSFVEKVLGFAADGVAVLCAAFVVGTYFAVYVPAIFCKEKALGLWGLACSAGSWVKGKASAARGWVNSGRVEPFVLTLSLMACAVMAGELAFNRLEEDWLRHEWAAASVRVLLPVERDWADEYVRALNGKALKPVERCGHASTLSLGSVPLTIFYRCVCGYESADLSKYVCGEAPKATKPGRWF